MKQNWDEWQEKVVSEEYVKPELLEEKIKRKNKEAKQRQLAYFQMKVKTIASK
ncbi:hypothetical protein M3212_13305 [Alkalihalobacillus oceani]|uniref:hypothetical protein n=1 Tax=Halalkalibacter oceani TaxID=1653776 RepID=UPI00203FE279|nr:hypothetical protein [Halalkalibacter oceani]MCM3761749.1 hypothetical protein [Halalkalibacter oceani]